MAPRIALLTPHASPSPSGNAITVHRIARGLSSRGIELRVWDLSIVDAATIEREVAAWRPALLHAFHAYQAGPLALRLARSMRVPLVVTLTGTDANHDLHDPDRAQTVSAVLAGADALTVFHPSIGARVVAVVPDVAQRVRVVPQAVVFPPPVGPAPPPAAGPVMLFPAGIRAVKRPRMPLGPLDSVAARHPDFELHYVGPVMDLEEGRRLMTSLGHRPWARYLGEVPHGRMPQLLQAADIVLNCSLSEGGMANSLLEALAVGRAVLASDVEGNRTLIEEGVTGLLFADETELAVKAERLLSDPDLRAKLGAAGRARAASFRPEAEIDGYAAVYEHVAPA
jgi:glycosyltransferase involved in cell wall biosynthesis